MNWDDYFMGFAVHAALKSKDPSTKVGAILVGPENEIRLTAFNGPPRGVTDGESRFERPTKYLYCSHAEENLISFAAREGIRTKGCRVYTTHYPCARCARAIIQAGVEFVCFGTDQFPTGSSISEELNAAQSMFGEAGVKVRHVRHKVTFDLIEHLTEQLAFSLKTFGLGIRTQGTLDHIRDELEEIETDPTDPVEWIDVVLLALDGALRLTSDPVKVASVLRLKLEQNKRRRWPDWRIVSDVKAIKHIPDV